MGNEIIQADYEELDRIANIFSQHATNTAELHQKVSRSVDELKGGGWIGLGATAFYDEMEGIFTAVNRLTISFNRAKQITLNVSQIVKNAEEEAANLFQSGQVFIEKGISAFEDASTYLSRDRVDRRIESDRIARRPEGGSRGGHFDSDWAGRSILERYLTGGGDWNIVNDPRWTNYMKANPSLTDQLNNQVKGLAQEIYNSQKSYLPVEKRFPMEIENGEGIIGYQYLHGTNNNAGGFQILGDSTIKPDGKGYIVELDLAYKWNDIIDPNPQYATDNIKSKFAELITLGVADPYEIHITWNEKTIVRLDQDGKVISVEGWLNK